MLDNEIVLCTAALQFPARPIMSQMTGGVVHFCASRAHWPGEVISDAIRVHFIFLLCYFFFLLF